MGKELLMGNEAIARGAIEAGISVATSYPGTPASEVIGTLARVAKEFGFYCEWSVNEKVAVEVAAGAAYAGARSLAAMKQVGLNVASDPVMTLAYIGVKGGFVLVVADDPGPHSSQTEQDTRLFAQFAKLPVLDPSSPQEAKDLTIWAFELSEALELPVILRSTTRTSHGYGDVELGEIPLRRSGFKFQKDPRWTIMPALSARLHKLLVEKELRARELFERCRFNYTIGEGQLGIVASGVSFNYAKEAVEIIYGNRWAEKVRVLKISTPYPLPEETVARFLASVSKVLVVEEQEPVVEDQVIRVAWKRGISLEILGKRNGYLPRTGEFNVDVVGRAIAGFAGESWNVPCLGVSLPELPPRPPVLCAGCPHRGAFYAVKRATRKLNPVFTGDIGCYTLGVNPPLETQDTCLCMGAGLTLAEGLFRVEPNRLHVAFIGDSTFFHAGLPGLVNAVYNDARVMIVVLDNDTTAMTGHQPHPGMGYNAVGEETKKLDIASIARACGAEFVRQVNANNVKEVMDAVKAALETRGPSVIVAKGPCVQVEPSDRKCFVIEEKCPQCDACIKLLGCPAIVKEARVKIAESCSGCGVCVEVCPYNAIDFIS